VKASLHDLLQTKDCRFYGCVRDSETEGGYCLGHAEFLAARPSYDPKEDSDEFVGKRCAAFIKTRGVWENTIQCSFPATRGEFCGRHDPASIDIRKANQANPHTPRKQKISQTARMLETVGVAEVECGKDVDARAIIYEAAKKAGLVATTTRVGPGKIEGRVIMRKTATAEEYFEGAVA
jgi:hypothetical protein